MLSVNATRYFSLSLVCRRTHYETLGVGPKATASEIKSAYYKLSLRHHPDRQDGNREEFEKITNAYKVLGDVSSRTLYDRGAFEDFPAAAPPTRNYHAQTGPSTRRPNVPSGRTPIYDFDMWSRLHYGQAMQRRSDAKVKWEEKVDMDNRTKSSIKHENITWLVFAMILLAASASYHIMLDDFDKPPPPPRKLP